MPLFIRLYRSDGQVEYVLALCVGRVGSNTLSVKLTQVAIIDSPLLQSCTVCFGASCGDGLRQLVTSNRY